MAVYGFAQHAGANGLWGMMRPGPRSALPRDLLWMPLGPADNQELAELLHRAEAVDNPPYRTTAQETAEYFVDPTYSGVAGRDAEGVMRAFGLVRLRPAAEVYASIVGIVDPGWRGRGIGGALLHWQVERARHLIGVERAATVGSRRAEARAHVVTTVLEGDERMMRHLSELRFEPRRWYRELRRDLAVPVPDVDLDGFLTVEPWSEELDDAARRAHNEALSDSTGQRPMSVEEWAAGRAYFAPAWSFVAVDRSGDRVRVAGYLRSGRYEQDWEALGWREGYTDMIGVRAEYRGRHVGEALLTAAMRAYARDGMQFAATGVDSDNPTGAVDLYRELGYTPTRGSVLYSLEV